MNFVFLHPLGSLYVWQTDDMCGDKSGIIVYA